MSSLRTEFPVDDIERCVRRLEAIVKYHRSGAGHADEHERLLEIAIMEVDVLMGCLRLIAEKWGVVTTNSNGDSPCR